MAGPAAADGGSVKGAVGYTPEMAWDYDRDKKINRVQFWMGFDIETRGDGVKGGLQRYLKDLDSGRKIFHWKNMDMTGDNTRPTLPATHLSINGNTAVFTVGAVTDTFTDSSTVSDSASQHFLSDDGFTKTELKIYAGKVDVHGQRSEATNSDSGSGAKKK
jgi:hypothetical protein